MKDYKELEKKLGVTFKNKALIIEALTHSSYGNEHNCNFNERLEFLGDAVLEVSMSKYLFTNYNLDEGEMTKKRAQAVREEALDIYASKIGLNDISEEKATQLLTSHINNNYFSKVLSIIKSKGVNNYLQREVDAFACFAYNLGIGAFQSSTLLKKYVKGERGEAIHNEFMRWI